MAFHCLDEYEKLVIRMNTPRVVIDNVVCPTATLVQVDSVRQRGVLLEAVQALTDLDLIINKAYISSDGRWFMDVFHVTDSDGRKLTDQRILNCIQHSLGEWHNPAPAPAGRAAALEITGAGRPGLLSEVFAVLAQLRCGVGQATSWTHNGRIACIVFLQDGDDIDAAKLQRIESQLRHLLKNDNAAVAASAAPSAPSSVDRRLHQLMAADRDYDYGEEQVASTSSTTAAAVSVQDWAGRGYSVVTVQCRDRPKLLFDVVCTLTDMEYAIFHGTIDTSGDGRAHQEFYIRHSDGTPISSDAERHRVTQRIRAAVERRAYDGLRLELRSPDRPGLLSEVTRTLRESGLLVARAEVATADGMASNVFYVTDAAGIPADRGAVDAVREKIGDVCCLEVKEQPWPVSSRNKSVARAGDGHGLFYLGSLVKRNLYNLGLIKSCS